MSLRKPEQPLDVESLQEHLSEALDSAEDSATRYHLREAYQKIVILDEQN